VKTQRIQYMHIGWQFTFSTAMHISRQFHFKTDHSVFRVLQSQNVKYTISQKSVPP